MLKKVFKLKNFVENKNFKFNTLLINNNNNNYNSFNKRFYSKNLIMSVPSSVIENHLVPKEIPVYRLNARESFNLLTEKEQLYAHHISVACWWGSKICLGQTSVESGPIFNLFQNLFSVPDLKSTVVPNIISEDEYTDLLSYAATFYGNMGNYLSFGDSKFIPRISKEKLQLVINKVNDNKVNQYWSKSSELMYSLDKQVRELGIDGNGISTYYSPNITKAEIEKVQKFMDSKSLSPYNTRLFKVSENNYNLLIASATTSVPTTSHQFDGYTINIVYGDWNKNLTKVVDNLKLALPYAANDNQTNMLKKYIDSFYGGSIDDHKDSQRWWIKDISPAVETNIGFIESYRDPYGVRGEWEGFVSMVNKEMSMKFGKLTDNATIFLSKLPWDKSFEKEKFNKPDFTSLEVLTFASTGIPAGINLSNYDDIRQTDGFKNVSLGNVIAARKDEYVTFIQESDQKLFNELSTEAFELQVGIHELYGHGSGKLFTTDADGNVNFKVGEVINPLTNKPIDPKTDVYKFGETYDSVFKSLGSPMEECRAECCGIYLSPDEKILELFGFADAKKAEDIYYVNWLIMARAGICALEFYSPPSEGAPGKWRQAHMQARYCILTTFLRSGIVTLDKSDDDVIVKLDRSKIRTVGVKAVGEFLNKLMVFKATANIDASIKLFDEYTHVNDEFLAIRDIVLAKKKPRKVFVQAHTYLDSNGKVCLQDFDDSTQGMIDSMITRFGKDDSDMS
ncbi:hypothetical protein RB653_010618 [Dictyostelium firmibasis]|uniref:Dipeptidyl peptidase 3 n=1 Tax=Dictyostelium firmibasis TaxID=79012 RepID=A0AAN7YL83_9MYCE